MKFWLSLVIKIKKAKPSKDSELVIENIIEGFNNTKSILSYIGMTRTFGHSSSVVALYENDQR